MEPVHTHEHVLQGNHRDHNNFVWDKLKVPCMYNNVRITERNGMPTSL